ncbi:zinc/manganese transport system permease protein [Pseudacidovorax intermedius]|uniref:Zinc/manganese transport system permease protein n=1 Tax=Pseudacidovorax intermedius TaxID=433924 RepID=A0A370F4C0_9BURK|nr:metal ABC transporter permease [Pseudacidovorax intermedius]RDI18103.1 zinc/manganese transport system permease protein [Pseudacidovorax intermedius]
MTLHELLIQPFVDFGFMRRALVGALALALGSAPMGTLLVLRRMSLMGDATGHALLPGAALGFLIAGPSLAAMSIGSFLAAIGVALGAGVVARATAQREDASFAAFYLIALALGVMLVSLRGTSVDLMHLLFGTILAVDDGALLLICGTTAVTLAVLALLWRPLIAECVDPGFLRSMGGPGRWVHLAFLVLTVANLVAGFQAMGTLMAVGLMMLPATAARFWVGQVGGLIAVAALIAAFSGFAGLLLSYHAQWPSGPAIVLVAGAFYLLSLFVGSREGLLWQRLRRPHRLA